MRVAFIVAAVASLVAVLASGSTEESEAAQPAVNERQHVQSSAKGTGHAGQSAEVEFRLVARVVPEERGDPFRNEIWAAPETPAPTQAEAVVPVITQPVAPPLPFRLVGKLEHDEAVTYVLAQGDATYYVAVGETINATYRLTSVHAGQMEFLYLPLNQVQQLWVPAPADL